MFRKLRRIFVSRGLQATLVAFGLSSCLAGPDLPAPRSGVTADAPQLLPISTILARTSDGRHTERLTDATPEARATALRARAAALRGPVLTSQERARMLASGPRLR